MITITSKAAEQIKHSARQGQMQGLALRVAATKKDDGQIHYGMGFDEKQEGDKSLVIEDIEIIVAPISQPLVEGMTIDFVELAPGKFEFIFSNPNDPEHKPVQ